MSEKKKVIVELFLDENNQDDSLDLISFVSEPAIEKDFVFYNKEKETIKFKATNEDKRLVTGPVLVPNQEILRLDAQGNPWFAVMSEETILQARELFAKYGQQQATNYQHETKLRDVTVVESWIVTDPNNDKSNALGFTDIPEGTWFVTYKVDNDELWSAVKTGKALGFSIEGMFSRRVLEMSSEVKEDILYDEIQKVLNDSELSDDVKFDKLKKIL